MTEVQLVVHSIHDVVVVNLGESTILDGTTIESIGKQLYVLVDEQAQRKVLLNFSRVKFLSSMMLGVLIRLQKRSAAIKGRVVIVGLRPDLHKVFKITRLEKLFDFYGDEKDALSSFGVYTQP